MLIVAVLLFSPSATADVHQLEGRLGMLQGVLPRTRYPTAKQANSDMFARAPSDMSGVPREVIEHHLAVCPEARPVKQKVRRQAPEKQQVIIDEVEKLKKAQLIEAVAHTEWLANPVVVPKPSGGGRLCIAQYSEFLVLPAQKFKDRTLTCSPRFRPGYHAVTQLLHHNEVTKKLLLQKV